MARRLIRKTDLGTILLHWTLVGLLLIAVSTGLRIAIGSPYDVLWLHQLDWLLPQSHVWTLHIPAGTLLFALAVSYKIYISRARLHRRVQLDMASLYGLARRHSARLRAINLLLYWGLFLTIAVQLVTGVLLYLGHAGIIADLHLLGTWVVLGYIPAHVLVHFAMGGAPQLLRIFNPGKLAPAPPEFDPFEVIAQAAARKEPPAGRRKARPRPRRESTEHRRPMRGRPPQSKTDGDMLYTHPLTVAIFGGFATLALLMSLDQVSREKLVIDPIASGLQPPLLDGDVSDPVWHQAVPVRVRTQQGANFNGEGGTIIEIRAVHDGTNAYFSFTWDDPTRSLKHLPLVKTNSGWRLLQEGFEREDAHAYFEDKLAVLLAPGYVLIPGDRTFHSGQSPLEGKPESRSGRGLHYTTDGSYVDVWQWHATKSGAVGQMDDMHFGPPRQPTQTQLEGREAYKGGFAPDPGNSPHMLNFDERGVRGYDEAVLPKRLPTDPAKSIAALGTSDLHPERGDSQGSKWWLGLDDTVAYSKEADAKIPVRAMVPGLIVKGSFEGDRGDLRCAAKWGGGRWVLEVMRRMDTGSRYDVPIRTDSYMRVAAFDHSQTRHTRHIRPIRLLVNPARRGERTE